jgi:hypothetical protein
MSVVFLSDLKPVFCTGLCEMCPLLDTFLSYTQMTPQDRQCTDDVILRRVRAALVAVEKSVSIAYSECVFVALVIQHAIRMRHIVICGLPGSAVYFHIIS